MIKVIVQPKMNICCECAQSQFIQDQDELFLRQVYRYVSQQWMHCSEWVPSERESDKNITIIHTTPVHQLTSGEDIIQH